MHSDDEHRALLDDESSAIAQLVAISILKEVVGAIERFGAQCEGTGEELRAFQGSIEDITKVPILLTVARGERGRLQHFFSASRRATFRRPMSSRDSASTTIRNCRASKKCDDSMPGSATL